LFTNCFFTATFAANSTGAAAVTGAAAAATAGVAGVNSMNAGITTNQSAGPGVVRGTGFESQHITSYCVTLGEGPLGLQLIDNTANGMNLSAVADKVAGAAAQAGIITGQN
jgi:hypothetical protein